MKKKINLLHVNTNNVLLMKTAIFSKSTIYIKTKPFNEKNGIFFFFLTDIWHLLNRRRLDAQNCF